MRQRRIGSTEYGVAVGEVTNVEGRLLLGEKSEWVNPANEKPAKDRQARAPRPAAAATSE